MAYGDVAVYPDFSSMLRKVQPVIVALAVPTAIHASLAIEAAQAGVKGIVGEKPMASNLAEARQMIDSATEHDTTLIVNHQRRLGPDMQEMRRLSESGVIGEVEAIRASCPGDVLTDGTHAIDSLRFLVGDRSVDWLLGQVHHADIPANATSLGKGVVELHGQRYRHGVPVESGAVATWKFADGPRAELFVGDCRLPGGFQAYEILGSAGRIRRTGDLTGGPNLFVETTDTGGAWKPVDIGEPPNLFARSYEQLVTVIRDGGEHPLGAEMGFCVLEIIMGIFESARLSRRMTLPLSQDRNPMQLMVDEGRFG
jgi:UDP-N-acetyl-2-amino-2-deoxyglucuronate dehydrogenase